MIIREARDEDLRSIATLRLQFLAEHRDVDPADFSGVFAIETFEFLRRHAEAGTSRTWLATEDGADIGVVTMLLLDLAPRPEDASGREGYIVTMYVEPSHRRAGLGSQLLAACLATAHELGLRRLLLHATDDGRPLYERVGFRSSPSWLQLSL